MKRSIKYGIMSFLMIVVGSGFNYRYWYVEKNILDSIAILTFIILMIYFAMKYLEAKDEERPRSECPLCGELSTTDEYGYCGHCFKTKIDLAVCPDCYELNEPHYSICRNCGKQPSDANSN